MLKKEQCQKKIFQIAIKFGVSPTLISMRLLSKQDKHDMLSELVPDETLEAAVKCWMEAGMPDYANGKNDRYTPKSQLPIGRYG